MSKLIGMSKYTQRLSGLLVADNAYGLTIPILYGRARTPLRLIWESDFHSTGTPPFYYSNGDFLVSYAPIESGLVAGWIGSTWFYSIYAMQNFALSGPSSTTWPVTVTGTPMGKTFQVIDGVQLETSYSFSQTDYVFPGLTNTVSSSGTSYLPLYNGNYPLPNNGRIINPGTYPYALYNAPGSIGGSNAVTVVVPTAVTSINFNVFYHYTIPVQGGIILDVTGLFPEQQLGNNPGTSSGQPITYLEFSGYGGADLSLGNQAGFPQLSFEMKGLFGMGNAGPAGSWDPTTLEYVQQNTAGDCCPADLLLDMITSGNHIYFSGI